MADERWLEWVRFAEAIAEAANLPIETIEPGSRLLEDLGIDSLGLAEVICLLLVDFKMASLESDLSTRDWRLVTVGELYEEYQRGEALPPRERYTLRMSRRT
jgi:acyl carrier protein